MKSPINSSYLIFLICSLFACQSEVDNQKTTSTISIKQQQIPDKIDFNFHVKPILSDRCFKCHGPDKNAVEGDLSLATKEDAFIALGKDKNRYAIIPHQADSSALVHRIFTENADDIMPPPESNLKLEKHEKEILKKWIEQGAEWKEHWSLIPPEKTAIPAIQNESWAKNEIDYFVLAKLEANQLRPNQMVKPTKLLRRLSFDLTGLPPTIEELNTFLADDSPNAYEKQVDRLLASPAYAEHRAVQWLDIARYADSHGYQDDLERIAWPWRDWVIHAYQKNMPYNQFVTWQLAGDLLPNPTLEQIVATAFNRNHKITQEGGVIPEEYRTEYVADRAQTFSTAFLGLTMECARCHDHKYDPLSQKNYFQLFSFFNNVPENGQIQPYGAIPKPFIKLTKKEIDGVLSFVNNLDTMAEIPLMVMEEMAKPRQAHILNRGAYDQPTEAVFPNTPEAVLAFDKKYPTNRKGLADWLFAKEKSFDC